MDEMITAEPPICLVRGNGITCRVYNNSDRRDWMRARMLRRYREGVQYAFCYYGSSDLARIEFERMRSASDAD